MENKKYEYIDSLRGIAVLLVVLVHVSLANVEIWTHFALFLQTSMPRWIHCIQLFFLVSAFTLTISYYNRKNEEYATRNFIIRRFFRIAPMYYLAIIYFTFANFLGFDFTNLDLSKLPLKGLISSILFLNGLFPAWINSYVPGGWTVTIEFMFYFCMPFICRYIINLNRALLFFLTTLLLSTFLNFMLEGSSFDKYDFLYYYFPSQLPVFALGILAYWILRDNIYTLKINNLLFLFVVFAFYSYFALPAHIYDTVVFFLLLLILSKRPYKLFSNKILATIGKCSFSLYLIHFAILGLLLERGIKGFIYVDSPFLAIVNVVIFYIIVFGSSFIIAQFTYRLIEIPGQNIGRNLIKKLNVKK